MKLRFLVIDDDVQFSSVLERALLRSGFDVRIVNDPEQAVEVARTFQPDQVSLDLKMGQSSGLLLIEPLLKAVPDARLLVLTGYSSISTAVQAIKLGACNYLCKPVLVEELLAAFDADAEVDPSGIGPRISPERLEWEHIQKVLTDHKGNVSATARALGMHRRTLQRKLQKRPVRR